MGKYNCTPEEFAQLMFDEIICTEKQQFTLMKVIQNEGYNPAEKTIIESLQIDHIRQECFYLWAFLTTYCIHKELYDLGDKLTKPIHDILRTLINQDITERYAQNMFNQRLRCYSDALKMDMKCLGLKDTILFKNLTTLFFENLLGRKLTFSEFGKQRILLGLYVAELMTSLENIIQKLKADIVILDR
jgi:hypothetical protein